MTSNYKFKSPKSWRVMIAKGKICRAKKLQGARVVGGKCCEAKIGSKT